MFSKFKHFYKFFLFFILIACQLQEPYKNHGINFLENRSKQIILGKTNKNDVINLMGQPHSKSINNSDEWIYIERTLSKGSFHKLGKNVLKTNNVLVVEFDKYGIIKNKIFLDKNDINKLAFSNKITKNEISQKSFVEKFLSSIKEKIYSNRN